MSDLMIPLLMLIIMYIIINIFDAGLVLMSIALVWLPISAIMYSEIATGAYTQLFGANIIQTPISLEIFALMSFTVPLFAIAKIFYVRYNMIGEQEVIEDDSI